MSDQRDEGPRRGRTAGKVPSGGETDASIVVCRADALGESETVKFRLGTGKNAPEGFVVRHRGELHAWRNECRHVPMTMDWVENRFLSRDKCWIQCATHGALYDIATGQCVAGPPVGKSLHRLDVSVENGDIIVTIPAGGPPGR